MTVKERSWIQLYFYENVRCYWTEATRMRMRMAVKRIDISRNS
jgi:hypothetical protein